MCSSDLRTATGPTTIITKPVRTAAPPPKADKPLTIENNPASTEPTTPIQNTIWMMVGVIILRKLINSLKFIPSLLFFGERLVIVWRAEVYISTQITQHRSVEIR